MEPGTPMGGKRRGFRRWCRALPLLVGLLALILLLGNLFLASPWSCRWIASKIERRTGLAARVGAASWSPWNGASIDAVELLAPAPLHAALKEPLVRIDALRLALVWRAWLRGRFEVQSVELDTPRFIIPLELLSHLARPVSPPLAAATPLTAPPLAAATPPTGPPPTTSLAPSRIAPPTAPPPPGAMQGTVKPPTPPSRPTGWLRLENASCAVILTGTQQPLLEISKTSGAIPISGDAARSTVKIGLVSAAGNPVAANLTARLDWTNPLLSMEALEIKIGGCTFLLAGKIASFSGLPLQIEARLPRQKLAASALPLDGQAAAESIAAEARFRGLLLAPATWQGDFAAESTSPSLRLAGHETKFDRGSAITVLRGGVISCVDARLIGDEISVLGNATFLPDGRVAGIARLVAAPETATAIAKRLSPNIPSAPSLTPLGTPQRAAFDVEAFGNISHLFLRLGKDGPVVKLKP